VDFDRQPTQQQAMMTTFFFFIKPSCFGVLVPIANMPASGSMAHLSNPLRYFCVFLRGVFLKGDRHGNPVAASGSPWRSIGVGLSRLLPQNAFPQNVSVTAGLALCRNRSGCSRGLLRGYCVSNMYL